MEVLAVQKLSKIHKKEYIVKNISLSVNSGEIVGLLGSNGSGKTTIFYMVLGIIQHDSGCILLNNKNIEMLPTYVRARLGIGYVPQENSIFRQLTVFENLMAIAQLQNFVDKKECNEYVIKLMNNFRICHLQDKIGQNLSGGERKRVEIARSLITNPKFVLFDEPFSGVDPISITDLQEIIVGLINCKIRVGVLITDHNVKATLSICTRAYIINRGILIAHGTPEEIINNESVRSLYLGNFFKKN